MSQQTEGETLVLQDDIDHKNFVDVAQNFLGLIPFETFPFSEDNEIFEDVWINPERTSAVHFMDNPLLRCRYVWVRGTETPALLEKIYRLLPHLILEDLAIDLDEADDHHEAADTMLKVAAAYPNFDPRALQFFELGLKEKSTSLRKATVQAIAFWMWPESRPLLEKFVQTEPVRKVREYAQSVLNQYQIQSTST